MKSYEETTESVLEKIREERKNKAKKRKHLTTAILGGVCCCLAIGSVLLLWHDSESPAGQANGIISAENSPASEDPGMSADTGSEDSDRSNGVNSAEDVSYNSRDLHDIALYFSTCDESTSNGNVSDWLKVHEDIQSFGFPSFEIFYKDGKWEETRNDILYATIPLLNDTVSGLRIKHVRYTPPPYVLLFFYESVETKASQMSIVVYLEPDEFTLNGRWKLLKSGKTADGETYQIYDNNPSDHAPTYTALVQTESGCFVATIRSNFKGGVEQLERVMKTAQITTLAEQLED